MFEISEIGGECIGGGTETKAMADSGELKKRLKAAGARPAV